MPESKKLNKIQIIKIKPYTLKYNKISISYCVLYKVLYLQGQETWPS